MSTRRARIKAVTSLPPRRKNTDADNKNKILKESTEKVPRSPRTPKANVALNPEEAKSPFVRNSADPPQKNNRSTPSKTIKTPNNSERAKTPVLTVTESIQKDKTSICMDKTQKSSAPSKSTPNIFASPFRKQSPRKAFVSPALPSPKVQRNIDLQKSSFQKSALTPIAQKINENNELQITENIISKISHNNSPQKSVTNNVNSPVAEAIQNEAMDGIVPLQPASTPKPIDILKNEIISENAVVLFDPIVPLPSPGKVRPKLRPAPRLGLYRRNSVQGSASESEDESRRNHLSSIPSRQRHDSQTSISTIQSLPNSRDARRVRNDSVCSSVSQINAQPAQTGSPVKEKSNKGKRQARRADAKKWKKENVKRDSLTMYDLIFYNPTANPIVQDEDEELGLKMANEEAQELTKIEKEPIKPESPNSMAAPVPQIKLGPQGEIILDEQSLVINQTESKRQLSSTVYEGSGFTSTAGYKYKRGTRAADWSAAETVRFYRALAAIGTDFTLMAPLFPDRTRRELKFKFKKEEKINGAQVDKALRATIQWNVTGLQEEFREERAAAAQKAEREKQRLQEQKKAERERLKTLKDMRVRRSRGGKALESTMMPGVSNDTIAITADDILQRASQSRQRKRKILETSTETTPIIPTTPILPPNHTPKVPIIRSRETDKAKLTPNIRLKTPEPLNPSQIPPNIEKGSLVVLTVDDPMSPTKKMLQTYVAHGPGQLAPVALCASFLNSVVGYMKKNTPKGSATSPQIISPSSIFSQDSRNSTPSGISVLQSPMKRTRHSSYTITQL